MRSFQTISDSPISRIALYVTMVLSYDEMTALISNCDENLDADNCVQSLNHL